MVEETSSTIAKRWSCPPETDVTLTEPASAEIINKRWTAPPEFPAITEEFPDECNALHICRMYADQQSEQRAMEVASCSDDSLNPFLTLTSARSEATPHPLLGNDVDTHAGSAHTSSTSSTSSDDPAPSLLRKSGALAAAAAPLDKRKPKSRRWRPFGGSKSSLPTESQIAIHTQSNKEIKRLPDEQPDDPQNDALQDDLDDKNDSEGEYITKSNRYGEKTVIRKRTPSQDISYRRDKMKQLEEFLGQAETNPNSYTKREIRNARRQYAMLCRRAEEDAANARMIAASAL